MALSGSQSINIHGGAHTLIVEWSASQNTSGNYSTVNANLYIRGNYSYSTIYSGSVAKPVALVINGNRKSGTARIDISGTEKRLLLSHSVNVSHNSDGTKTFRLEGMLNSQITWSGTYYGSEQWTRQDWGLNRIPRASTFNQSADTFNMDGDGVIYIFPASTSFTHKLYMAFGNKKILLKDNPPVNQNFSVHFKASDFADQIPNADLGVGVLVLETYNGGTMVGGNQRTTYLRLPTNYVPSQPSVSVSDESSAPTKLGVSKTAGIYVKGMSLLRFVCSSSGVLGSKITNYQVQIGGQTFSSSNGTINVDLTKVDVGSGGLSAVVKAIDSRGRTNSRTVSLTIQNYSAPKINNFGAVRQNNSDVVVITKPVSVSSILNGSTNVNSYTVKTEYKLASASSWTVNRTETNSSAILNLSGFNVANSYDIRITLADKLNQTVVQASISTAKVLLDFNKDIGVGIGKMHERGALDIGGDSYFGGKVQFDGGIEYVIIPAKSDLNNYRTPGFYRIAYDGSGSDGGSSIANSPVKNAFTLTVDQPRGTGTSGDIVIRQTLRDPYSNRVFQRRYVGTSNTWQGWVELIDSGTFNTFFDNRMNATFNGKFDTRLASTQPTYKGEFGLPYGIKCKAYKIGRIITLNVLRQIVAWVDVKENATAGEKLPNWAKPIQESVLILTRNAGTSIYNPTIIHLRPDGSMAYTCSNGGTFVHTGTVTYMCANAD